ncbi:MAG: glycosyltransferase family 4 protein [Chloroflexi bacterium]|nr:glycosyltransferase family 4 protein [Chloroflexota bacterium]MBV9598165.1 glycosyltransferase family 4 protein [Chloroflexota bacterium]
MRIAQVAPPFETVPPTRYGGTERVIATLTDALVRRGHDVTLFAAGDSRTNARLLPTVPEALWHSEPPLADVNPFWSMTLDAVLEHIDDFDVVHSHLDYWGFPLAHHAHVPLVTTLHGRLDLPELQPLYRHFDDVPLVSISDAQRDPVHWANFVKTIYHGINLDELTFSGGRGKYLAFLGRIAPEKGLDTAIRVASESGQPLRIAARKPLRNSSDPGVRADRHHYQHEILPLLEGRSTRFVGEVDGPEKNRFLRDAAALLFPIRWPEPFGLVMVEAMACGTPVIALRQGSVPEVIEDGVTGFICDDEAGMVEAIGRIDEIDRARCRAVAEERFSPDRMADDYIRVYRQLCAVETRAPSLVVPAAAAAYVNVA